MFNREKWKLEEQTYFLEKLGEFLAKGYSLTEGIQLLHYQKTTLRREQLKKSLAMLRNGQSVHEVLQTLSFRKEVLSYLFFAEEHGDLGFALDQAAKMLRKKQAYQKRFQQLATYPLFLLFLLAILFFFLEVFLLPQFHTLYSSMDVEFSKLMIFLVDLPYFLKYAVSVSVGLLFIYLIYYLCHFRHLPSTTKMVMLLRVPIIRSFLLLRNTHYFCLQLGSLLKGGLPISDAFLVFERQYHLPFFKEEGKEMKAALREGESLEQVIKNRAFYEDDLPLVISHAQANGLLAKELNDFSELVLERFEAKLNRILKIVQPALLIIIGSFVILLYLSVMLPLFGMIEGL